MSVFQDAFTAIGALSLAAALSEVARAKWPNWYRAIVPVVILGAADAYIPQFTMLSWGFQIGLAVAVSFGIWFLRRRRVVRQDGTHDNG